MVAPPGKRRAGYSRKAHYGLFVGYVIAVAGALLGLLLVVTARVDPAGNNALRALIGDVTLPVTSTLSAAVRGMGDVGSSISNYFAAGAQNAALKRERDATRRKLVEARGLAYENARLKRLLGIATGDGGVVATGQLTSSSASSSRRFAMLDKGSTAGVRLGQPVRGPDGLVGKVAEVGLASARVQLVSDTGLVVPVIRINDGVAAIATGTGDGLLEIRSLTGQDVFKRGDLFVTSGAGGVYPPRVPVAVAITVTRDGGATGRPLADPARLDYAAVLPVFRPDAANPAPAPPRP